MATHQQYQSPPTSRQVPSPGLTALIREHVAARSQALLAFEPRAVDLEAGVIAELHEQLWGQQTEVKGPKGAEYRRHQLLGLVSVPLGSLAYLAIVAPEAVRRGLAPLAQCVGCRLEVLPSTARGIPTEAGHAGEAMSRLTSLILRAVALGHIDRPEAQELACALGEVETELAHLAGALAKGKETT